jgi:hypothetical protein
MEDGLMRTTSVSPGAADCPHAPAARESTSVRALHRACLILGGIAQFATHVSVPEGDLRRWMEGAEEPPEWVFLVSVEIILLNLEAPGRPD